ncbi:MAG: purine-binding chemotaxis protein CheW [Planctomycetia bacterium]|nr:purine-binding chemotaxis protein CheW [Candidatus Brocadia sp.]QOJ06180.1 MAG: purine-binding chemotaxis protein CheW [Planctomycetia bacterium]TVL95865.1 MAG: chemotaxis protein CheW [Candidatus Brocadia sp. BL1]HQU31247.1 chemotaxis protein CheW [Candidatus Brocadia sapporoensis]
MQNAINLGKKIKNQTALQHEGKYLIFILCGKEYGIKILKVSEIIGTMDITPVSQSSKYMKGVINLRGKILPVMDLRTKLGFQDADDIKEKFIIVVEVRDKLAGVIVDAVSEVLNIHDEDLQPAPDIVEGIKSTMLLGMVKIKKKVRFLFDIDRILNVEEIKMVESAICAR